MLAKTGIHCVSSGVLVKAVTFLPSASAQTRHDTGGRHLPGLAAWPLLREDPRKVTLHPALRELIDEKLANTTAPQWRLPIEDVRASFRALWSPSMTGAPVELASVDNRTVDTDAGAVRVRVFTPEAEGPAPIMMYFHGGGYVKGG